MEKADLNSIFVLTAVDLVAIGIGWAGSQGSAAVRGVPIFALAVGLAFAIQWLAFIPAYLLQTERFYDLTGSVTYISLTTLAVLLSPAIDGRSALLLVMVAIWATRLGTFLFNRVFTKGKDARFDEIKPSLFRFLTAWTLQGLWVTMTLSAAMAAITSTTRKGLGWFAASGLIVWAVGFAFEMLADAQKSRFRADAANEGQFIDSGLWAWSRHPNYFGEIVLWIGVAIVALPVLRGWQWVALISPVFVTIQLTMISGIPMLEQRADEKWGGQALYEAYKAQTPVLIPRPPRTTGQDPE